MKNKQTAVEWLVETLNNKIDYIPIKHWDYLREIIQQAKEMEKEQIIESIVNTVKIGIEKEGFLTFDNEDEIFVREEAVQYYNETFKQVNK